MLREGDIVETSYGSGPYVVVGILRHCVCPAYLDEINAKPGETPKKRPEHVHLVCKMPDGSRGYFHLNGYDEESLRSVDTDDFLIRRGRADGVQMGLDLSREEEPDGEEY